MEFYLKSKEWFGVLPLKHGGEARGWWRIGRALHAHTIGVVGALLFGYLNTKMVDSLWSIDRQSVKTLVCSFFDGIFFQGVKVILYSLQLPSLVPLNRDEISVFSPWKKLKLQLSSLHSLKPLCCKLRPLENLTPQLFMSFDWYYCFLVSSS